MRQRGVSGASGGRSSRLLLLLPLALMALIAASDIIAPADIHLGPLLVVAPAITASFAGARATAAIGALAVAALVAIGIARDAITTENLQVQIASLFAISVFIVIFVRVRERRASELERVRSVSEAAQRVLLRPLPTRAGPLRIASAYHAASADAHVGGDLYASARTQEGTRLVIGDVRGKGLETLGDAAVLLGAFHAAAHRQAPLPELAASLEDSVSWGLAELAHSQARVDRRASSESGIRSDEKEDTDPGGRAGGFAYSANYGNDSDGSGGDSDYDDADEEEDAEGDVGERFVTAAIVDILDQRPLLHLINCGHPPPLLLHRGGVRLLEVDDKNPPLGLGLNLPGLGGFAQSEFPFEPGDVLLLYTDGLIEARDSHGRFYPLLPRAQALAVHAGQNPDSLLRLLSDDVQRHVGGPLQDDTAMIAILRRA
ncbi:PP2C family protein-serine/threonine phosphatase [Streptacidiphilus fuscans]|uniref:Serine/threonine-protein phosphatase n=1 Tax=Streptacidiphilus fuscans TaxID=2789292 RepID=A0A931FGR0_9ACTN|nr:PP2C family protein-serine/threonine phosphatase [Streptacidiphilus fuscans]MBF9071121.1 serine/threonine-protein phosphatase [Streptacidiphilus fuscans]